MAERDVNYTPAVEDPATRDYIRRNVEAAMAQVARKIGGVERRLETLSRGEQPNITVIRALPLPQAIPGAVAFVIADGTIHYCDEDSVWNQIITGGPPGGEHPAATGVAPIDVNVPTQAVSLDYDETLKVTGGNLGVDYGAGLGVAANQLVVDQAYAFAWTADHTWALGTRVKTPNDVIPPGIFPTAGWEIAPFYQTQYELLIQKITVGELHAQVFVMDTARVDVGEEFWTRSRARLYADYTITGGTDFTIEYPPDFPGGGGAQILGDGHYVRFRIVDWTVGLTIADVWGTVTFVTEGTDADGVKWQTYTFTYGHGTEGYIARKGALVLSYGVPGDAVIFLSTIKSGAPYIEFYRWGVNPSTEEIVPGSVPWDETKVKRLTRLGNLAGVDDDKFGALTGAGLYGKNVFLRGILRTEYALIDDNGVQLFSETNEEDAINNRFAFSDAAGNVYGGLYSWLDDTLNPDLRWVRLYVDRPDTVNTIDVTTWTDGAGTATTFVAAAWAGQATNYAEIKVEANNAASTITFSAEAIETVGVLSLGGHAIPAVSASYDIGSPSLKIRKIYASELAVDTIEGTEALTGQTWQYNAGDMYVKSNDASARTLYVVNENGGASMSLDVEGDIALGGSVDGVNLSAFYSSYNAHIGTADAHHPQTHLLATGSALGPYHTVSGLTAGHVLRASSATAAAFTQLSHTELSDMTVGDPHTQYALRSLYLTAGAGLTGGGTLGADRTFAVGAGTLITVATDTVGIADGAAYQYIGTGADTGAEWRDVSELAGSGLTAASGVLGVGTGDGLTVAADSVALTLPGSLGAGNLLFGANAAAGNHTHAFYASANPGAASYPLASDTAGLLTLVNLRATNSVITPLVTTFDSDLTLSPYTTRVMLPDGKALRTLAYASGFAGYGFILDQGISSTGKTTLVVDKAVVRGTFRVYELEIFRISGTNGDLWVSSSAKADAVDVVSGTITYIGKADGMALATTLSIPKPPGTLEGHLMIAAISVKPSVTVTPPEGWILVGSGSNAANTKLVVYRRPVAAGEGASYNFTLSEGLGAAGGILTYAGVDVSSPVDVIGAFAGGTNTLNLTAPSATTVTDGARLLYLAGQNVYDTVSATPPGGMVERIDRAGAGIAWIYAADETRASAGATGDRTATGSVS